MKKFTFRDFYLAFLAITLLAYGIYTTVNNPKEADYTSALVKDNQDYVSVEEIKSSPQIFKAMTNDGAVEYIVISDSVGYQSKLMIKTVIDQSAVIKKVDVIEQGETPAFFDKILQSKYTERFEGKTILEPIYIGRAKGYPGSSEGMNTQNQIDAISGSTISSVAIAEAVSKGVTAVADEVFDKNVSNPFLKMDISLGEVALLVIFLIATASLYIKSINKYRKFILLYSVIVTGFYLNKFLTLGMINSLFTGNWPLINNISWYLLVLGTLAFVILTGKNIYCSWICPYGAMQEVILRFGGLKEIKLDNRIVKVFKLIPPTLAYMAVMIMLYTNEIKTLAYDPFGAVFTLTALPIMWICLPVLIFISLVQNRFYCNYFCPVGFIINSTVKIRNKGVRLWSKPKTQG